MSASLLNTQKGICYRCGRYGQTERHHIFGGANRKDSERYGLVVYLCHACHNEPPNGVHFNSERMNALRALGQEEFEKTHTHEEFMKIFGRNYV